MTSPADARCPEQRRATQRREILASARKHFLSEGYFATTMSAIAADVGGSKGILWTHFASKEQLLVAFVDAEIEDFHSDALTILDSTQAPVATLRAFAEHFIARMIDPDALKLQRLAGAVVGHVAVGGQIYAGLVSCVEDALAEYYSRQMALGSLRNDDAAKAAALTISLCMGACQQRLLWTGEPAREDAAKARAEIVAGTLAELYAVTIAGCAVDNAV